MSSTGGSVGSGYQLGFLARNFWLKTTTARDGRHQLSLHAGLLRASARRRHRAGRNRKHGARAVRRADARAPTPEADLAQGWQAYLAEQRKLAPVQASPACISACGLIHAAGIERFGVVRLHRSRYSGDDAFIDQSNR